MAGEGKSKQFNNTLIKIDEKITDYLNVKTDILDNEYLEIIGDSSSIVKGIASVSKLIVKKRFEAFLKGFTIDSEPSFEQLSRLYDYIDNEKRAEYISETMSKVINASSKKAAFIIGLITQRLVNSNEDFTYLELVSINALKELFDYDIDNLIICKQYLDYLEITKNKRIKNVIEYFSIYRRFKTWCENEVIDIDDSISLTVEKCASNQLLVKAIETELDIDDDSPSSASVDSYEMYKFSEAGLLVYRYTEYLKFL